jgi:outer membrane protein OmpA-like peptidoglycan-associated protein
MLFDMKSCEVKLTFQQANRQRSGAMLPKKISLKLPLCLGALLMLLHINAPAFPQQENPDSRYNVRGQEEIEALSRNGKDRDGDGLSDQAEKQYGTNPKSPDSDRDGMVDADEVLIYHTDPLQPDSDSDGLSDLDEIMKFLTQPMVDDTDQDGLKDGEELFTHHTNPLKTDTDNDRLPDGEELTVHHTHPLRADTDSDGVLDGIEVNRLVSNPNESDTDSDGVADGRDQCPTEAASGERHGVTAGCPDIKPQIWVEVDQVIVLVGVNFLAGEARPTPQSREVLEKVYNTLADNSEVSFEIQGHADGAGNVDSNLRLSQRRAEAVFEYLAQRGIAPERLRPVGLGESQPLASNDTPAGRAQNRRIELHRVQ